MRVVEIEPALDARWGRFVDEHPRALVYHHPGYLESLRAEYDERTLNLACEDSDGRLSGVLPLMYTRGVPFKRDSELVGTRLSSLPRTPIAGPLADSPEATKALLEEAVARVRAEPGRRLQLKLPAEVPEAAVAGVAGAPWVPAFTVDLPEPPDEVRFGKSKNHSRIRSTVRQVEKRGIEVENTESEEDLRAWHRIYLETMRWHMVPARPYRFFAALWGRLRPVGKMWLLVATRSEGGRRQVLAGSLYLSHGDTVYYFFNGRTAEALELGCNDAIQWRAIHDAAANGFRHYDMGEAIGRETGGVGRFKSKWGAREYEPHRYYFPPARGDALEEDSAERLGLRDRLRPVWRRVPLPVTGFVGDRLYRYL